MPAGNVMRIEAFVRATFMLDGPWCLGRDWIITPDELVKSGWFPNDKGIIFAIPVPTCNGEVYDYSVVLEGIGALGGVRVKTHAAVRRNQRRQHPTCSTHHPPTSESYPPCHA